MSVTFTNAKSILIRHRRIDAWFVSRAHLNLYRGCTHNCAYCDGRYEGYHVEGDFGADIVARQNAPELLDAALNPHRKRKPLNSGFIMLGGGVSDSYQPAEETLLLASRCLKIISKWRKPVHILTKSPLVARDTPLLKQINQHSTAIVSVSFSTVNDHIARVFEPGCAPPSERLNMMSGLVQNGIPTGMFLMPVIPGVTDSETEIRKSVAAAAAIGVSYIIFGGMTLKPGRQLAHFSKIMQAYRPKVILNYPKIYKDNPYGAALPQYYQRIEQRFVQAAHQHRIHRRIPPRLFGKVCNGHDRLMIALDHLGYLQRSCGDTQPFDALKTKLKQTDEFPKLSDYADLTEDQRALLHNILDNNGQNWYEKYL